MRRPIVIAGAALLALLAVPSSAVPAAAAAGPDVPAANIAASVTTIDPSGYVLAIDVPGSVQPLEEQESNGSQVTLRISADVLFEFDKATLTGKARKRLSDLAPELRDAVGTVTISGHTDSVGDPSYNMTLSQQRADAVKTALQNAMSGANVRFEAKGYGETKPVAPNEQGGKDDPAGRAKNRRVEITYTRS